MLEKLLTPQDTAGSLKELSPREAMNREILLAASILDEDHSEEVLGEVFSYFMAKPPDYIDDALDEILIVRGVWETEVVDPLSRVYQVISAANRAIDWQANEAKDTFDIKEEVAEIIKVRKVYEEMHEKEEWKKREVLKRIPKFDRERFDALRLEIGAKGANLVLLSEAVEDINANMQDIISDIEVAHVPDFFTIPVSLFRRWKSGEDVTSELEMYFNTVKEFAVGSQHFRGDRYIVRSSAVYSEDGEELSGAGIYASVAVDEFTKGDPFSAFRNAVMTVLESTDSTRALEYRKENNVPIEEMGIVIQKLVDRDMSYRTRNVTVNSSTPGIKGLIEVLNRDRRLFVRKEILDQGLTKPISENVLHFPPDPYVHELATEQVIGYAIWATLLEKAWGGAVQLEYVNDSSVQIRRVKDAYSDEVIEFPDIPEIAKASGVGIGDRVLQVLDSDKYNAERTGLVQYDTNDTWSRGNKLTVPKDGAVVIKTGGGNNGHIQTLCAEKGQICMYPSSETNFAHLPDLKIGTRVRIVSNGIEARLYSVEDEELPIDES